MKLNDADNLDLLLKDTCIKHTDNLSDIGAEHIPEVDYG